MTIEEKIEEAIPKKHKKIEVKKESGTLFDYITSLEGDFGFDVSDCNIQMCYCGSNDDAQGFLNDVLHRTNCCDVELCYKYYSDIAKTEWYKIILNIDIEELRKRKKMTELEVENAELREQVSYLEDNLRVARKDREDLQLDVAKGLKEFVKDYLATALRYLADEKYVEKFNKAKEHVRTLISCLIDFVQEGDKDYCYIAEAEAFLKEE